MNFLAKIRSTLVMVCFVTIAAPAAQEVRRGGPPPEVRAVFDALLEAVNGGSEDAWEAFAQARFSPSFLQKQSRAERAQLYQQIVTTFGTVAIEGVRREGPDAPLQMNVKGSKADGAIVLVARAPARRRASTTCDWDRTRRQCADAGGAPAPPIDRSMTSRRDRSSSRRLLHEARGRRCVLGRGAGGEKRRAGVLQGLRPRRPREEDRQHHPHPLQSRIDQQGVHAGGDSPAGGGGQAVVRRTRSGSSFPTIRRRPAVRPRWSSCSVIAPACRISSVAEFTARPRSQFASNADYFRFVGSLPPAFAPGAREQYCNGCYIALGAIVEKVSGMPYEKYVAEQVFARAEMTSTGYPRSDRPEPDIAQGYTAPSAATGRCRTTSPCTASPAALPAAAIPPRSIC